MTAYPTIDPLTQLQPREAWLVDPTTYASDRPVTWAMPATPTSRYLTMPDGCRLAIDVHLPQRTESSPPGVDTFPTITIFTPYYRRFATSPEANVEDNPNSGLFRDLFVPRGYALVVVDVRGTGASFGTRNAFRSPDERQDSREVIDWIVSQPWSDGRVGATGISYLGAASDFLASTGHPAVKAIAPLFSVWDTYSDNYFPGGLQVLTLTQSYDDLMIGLDHDRRDILKRFPAYANPHFQGPQPVDEDVDGSLLGQAVKAHHANFRQTQFMPEFAFREEGLPYDPEFSSASFSPYSYSPAVRPDVAIMSVSGWMDGAGYMNGAISRFLTMQGNPTHLLLGPWDHGARVHASPWRRDKVPDRIWLHAVLRFFDHYLLDLPTGMDREAPVHYYAMHAEQWRTSQTWPPGRAESVFHLDDRETLSNGSAEEGTDDLLVDFTVGTGQATRYECIAGKAPDAYYPDWQRRTDRMLSYTSPPLRRTVELAGHALADLRISSNEPDAALFVYLTEVEADGTERYVTEGLLRALHRGEGEPPTTYRTSWIFRRFDRDSSSPLRPGEPERIRIPLLPVAWQFTAGSRIRLSIAGADSDHFGQVPHGRPPVLTIHRGPENTSRLVLPTTDGSLA